MGIYTPEEVEEYKSREPRELPPVAEAVVEPVKAEPAAPREPQTEWGQWIAKEVNDANTALGKLADQHPENLKLRTALRPQQVFNAVVNSGIEVGFIVEDTILNEKGKRDPKRVGRVLNMLWADDPEWIQEAAGRYLADKMAELMPQQEPEPATV